MASQISFSVETGCWLLSKLYPMVQVLLVCVAFVAFCQIIPEMVLLVCGLWIIYHVVSIPLRQLKQYLFSMVVHFPFYHRFSTVYRRGASALSLAIIVLLALSVFVIMSASLYPVVSEQYTRLLSSAPEYYVSLVLMLKQSLVNTPFEPVIQVLDTYLPLSSPTEFNNPSQWVEPSTSSVPLPVVEAKSQGASFPVVLLGLDEATPLGYWLQWSQQTFVDSWQRILSVASASITGALLFVIGLVLLAALLIDPRPFQKTTFSLIPYPFRRPVLAYGQWVNGLIYRTVWLQWITVLTTTVLVYGVLLTFWVSYTEALTVFWAVCSLFPLVGLWFGSLGLLVVLVSTQHWGAIAAIVAVLGVFQFVKARWVMASWAAELSDTPLQQRIHPMVLLLSFAVGIALLGLGGLLAMVPLGAMLTVWVSRYSIHQSVNKLD